MEPVQFNLTRPITKRAINIHRLGDYFGNENGSYFIQFEMIVDRNGKSIMSRLFKANKKVSLVQKMNLERDVLRYEYQADPDAPALSKGILTINMKYDIPQRGRWYNY